MTKITLKDIARASGYSVTTVSRALGGFDDVSAKTRDRILKIAEDLGYQPNLIARQLQSQRTYTIGIVVPTKDHCSEDDFFSILLKGITHMAARYRYDVLISAQPPGADELTAYRNIVGGNRVDGVVVARTYQDDPRIAYLQSIQHPFVVSGRAAPEQPSDFPFIDADSQAGIRLMVRHFIELGHRHIGLILPPPTLAFTPYRLAGYREGLVEAGLPYDANLVRTGDLTPQGGHVAAAMLLEDRPELTAIVACNDLMAIGAMRAVQEHGRRVGADVAVGGFDDIPAAAQTLPSLTTIRQPICEIGERLTEMLIRLVNDETPEQAQILLEPALIVRESSGQARTALQDAQNGRS
jgi:LacI family transcriptional regulator